MMEKRKFMRCSILSLCPSIGVMILSSAWGSATQLASAQDVRRYTARTTPPADNRLADPNAEVVLGNARFTLLTPELVRMEWSADGKFEDHASFTFINRRLPVPKFEKTLDRTSKRLIISTSALTLSYAASGDGHFTPENLSISLTVDGKQVTWHPGLTDPQNLLGTTRTLDGARGSHTKEPIEEGLISRSGWALVDDSSRPLFDAADFRFLDGEKGPWPWSWNVQKTKSPDRMWTGTSSDTDTTTERPSATLSV